MADWDAYDFALTPREVGEILGVCAETVRAMCRAGTLPALKIGTRYRISRDRLRKWLEETSGSVLDRVAPVSTSRRR